MPLRSSRAVAVALVTFATFTDIVAYSIAIPVLPALSRQLGASPTMIGLLFGSFGVTLLVVSVPMGAVSDRIGRQGPMVAGLLALAAASLLFAYAETLPWLFAARLVQGAADAVTWVVGFALIADLYDSSERGRITGIVMMGHQLRGDVRTDARRLVLRDRRHQAAVHRRGRDGDARPGAVHVAPVSPAPGAGRSGAGRDGAARSRRSPRAPWRWWRSPPPSRCWNRCCRFT
jgi:hypothetical protein